MCSPVFRDMFAGDAYQGTEIHLEQPVFEVGYFLSCINPATRPSSQPYWRIMALVPLARLYECDDLLSNALFASTQQDAGDDRFDAFVLACQMNHVLAACRILHHGGEGEEKEAIGPSLLPSRWTPAMAAQLSIKWVWALSVAVQWADSTVRAVCPGGAADQNYWKAVIGEFVVRFTTE